MASQITRTTILRACRSLRNVSSPSSHVASISPIVCQRWQQPPALSPPQRWQCTEAAMPLPHVEGEDKPYPTHIHTIVDQISQLTLLEVADLNELLKKTLKITDAPVMAMGAMAAAAPAQEEDEEPAKQEQTLFTVKLMNFDAAKKVALIKEIKNLLQGLNLVQAKKFVESAPTEVKTDISKEEAETLKKAIEAVGGTAEIE